MQPREIAAHLDERFRLLTGGKRRGIERHQTLRATVDWSYSLLNDRDRRVFDRLAVFAGSFDTAAAQAVVADDGLDRFDVLDALNELVAKSMVVAEPGAEGDTRYQLLETLRQYALERLNELDAGDGARRRHAEHYAQLAEAAAPELLGRHELDWRPRINTEIDNFRAAVTWALDRDDPDDAELAMRIIGALSVEAVRNRGAGIGGWAEQAIASTGHRRLVAASGRARCRRLRGVSPPGQRGRALVRRARRRPTRRSLHLCARRIHTRKHRGKTSSGSARASGSTTPRSSSFGVIRRKCSRRASFCAGPHLRSPRRSARDRDRRGRRITRRRPSSRSTDRPGARALRQRIRLHLR